MKSETTARKGKNPLIVIILTVFIDLLGFSIVIPILAPLLALPNQSLLMPTTDFNTRLIVLGFLIASYALAQFFGAPILGQLSDRFGRKPMLAISLIGTLVARIIFIIGILNKDLYLLFGSRILDGLTGGNISVAQSAIADISTPENKSKNFGLIGAAFGLGFIIGPYLGGKLGETATVAWAAGFLPSWIATSSTLPLWFATLLCALNIIMLFYIFPETIKEKVKRTFTPNAAINNLLKVFKMGNIRAVFATAFLLTLGFTFFTQFLSVYIENQFSSDISAVVEKQLADGTITIPVPKEIQSIPIPQAKEQALAKFTTAYKEGLFAAEAQKQSSDIFSYIGIWVVVAQGFIVRALAKKYSPVQLLKVGLLINSLSVFLFLIPTQIFWIYLIIPFFALSNGLIQPNINAVISNSADAASQGEILGTNQSVQSLGQAIPPIVSGYVAGSLSLSTPIFLAGGMTMAALLFFQKFYKEKATEILHEE
jgi:DHA1 family tetracycline resistance protein-like MFS transporter